MNYLQKKSAVTKYSALMAEGKTEAEIKIEIAKDEKGYKDEDVDEIYAAIVASSGTVPSPNMDNEDQDDSAPEPAEEDTSSNSGGYIVCNEWHGRFDNGTFKPLEIVRRNVKLTDAAIEQLNISCNPHNPVKYIPVKA